MLKKSQLGRDSGCNHVPLSVEDINPPHTRRAKVVMCCGDQTIVKVDEALINSKILSIAANNDTICKHFRIYANYFKLILNFSTQHCMLFNYSNCLYYLHCMFIYQW